MLPKTSFFKAVFQRDFPTAVALPATDPAFLSSQCSERAFLLFRATSEERTEALSVAGRLMWGRKLEKRDISDDQLIADNFKYMHDCLSLLRAKQLLKQTLTPKDKVIFGKAATYRTLLSKTAIELYPTLCAKLPPIRRAKLAFLIETELLKSGPSLVEPFDGVDEWLNKRTEGLKTFYVEVAKMVADVRVGGEDDLMTDALEDKDIGLAVSKILQGIKRTPS